MTAKQHQIKIQKQTKNMPSAMVAMGGKEMERQARELAAMQAANAETEKIRSIGMDFFKQ